LVGLNHFTIPVAIARCLHFGISMIPAHYTESKMSPLTQGVLSSGATKKFDQSELDHRPAPASCSPGR
jgi:hypothetical protein